MEIYRHCSYHLKIALYHYQYYSCLSHYTTKEVLNIGIRVDTQLLNILG